ALAEGRPDEARAVFADVLRRCDPAVFPFALNARDQFSLLGLLAAAEGRPARASRLLAAGSAPLRRPGPARPPAVPSGGEAALARARATLGEAAFEAAAAEGRAMSLAQAVAYALEDAPAAA